MNKPNEPFKSIEEEFMQPKEHLCIICGTILKEDDKNEYIITQYGHLCKGCLAEKWFIKCDKCGEYEFESSIKYIEEEDKNLCNACYYKRKFGDG